LALFITSSQLVELLRWPLPGFLSFQTHWLYCWEWARGRRKKSYFSWYWVLPATHSIL